MLAEENAELAQLGLRRRPRLLKVLGVAGMLVAAAAGYGAANVIAKRDVAREAVDRDYAAKEVQRTEFRCRTDLMDCRVGRGASRLVLRIATSRRLGRARA